MSINNIKVNREISIPLHYQIRTQLERMIRENGMKGDAEFPGEKELISRFKVSRGPVRQALGDMVQQGILYRVPGKGTFVREPRQRKEKIVVFIHPQSIDSESLRNENKYETAVINELLLHSHGDFGLPVVLRSQTKEEVGRIQDESDVSYLLFLTPRRKNQELFSQMEELDFPFVVLGANLNHPGMNYVSMDNKKAVFDAFDYLAGLGHQKMIFIAAGLDSYDGFERMKYFKEARSKYCLEESCRVIEINLESSWEEKLFDFFKGLDARDFPTGIIASGFPQAVFVIKSMKTLGKSIPENVSLIGFDDFPMANYLHPPLTTIKQPVEKMVEESLRILVRQKTELKFSDWERICLAPELVIRESCAPPGGRDR